MYSSRYSQAVPAYRGWQTKTQPDGMTIQVRLNGDEYYHFYTNAAGEVVSENADGYWQVVEHSSLPIPLPLAVPSLPCGVPAVPNRM